ncbi:MAG: YggS family pyridoxal phosphate-dependent enzyme [Acidimicrobiia bacterium]|nr:MAG: YggS family pyridoxal phosphate-dependent enzyme [Acidimicrobiia bacterium]
MDTSGLVKVKSAIAAAAHRIGLTPDAVTLVAVSKGRPDAEVASIARAGQRIFGENRQQGLADRVEGELFDGLEWHFIGPLQRRKVASVRRHAALLHSMDRMSLARTWAASGSTPVLVQFNLGDEPQKSGFDPNDADAVIDRLIEMGVDVRGVMAIPPMTIDAEVSRPYFARLRTIFDHCRSQYGNMEHCSMGMSNDFVVAIEEGSTMVRVGRAIFEPTDR